MKIHPAPIARLLVVSTLPGGHSGRPLPQTADRVGVAWGAPVVVSE